MTRHFLQHSWNEKMGHGVITGQVFFFLSPSNQDQLPKLSSDIFHRSTQHHLLKWNALLIHACMQAAWASRQGLLVFIVLFFCFSLPFSGSVHSSFETEFSSAQAHKLQLRFHVPRCCEHAARNSRICIWPSIPVSSNNTKLTHKKKILTWSPRSAIKMRSTDSTYLSCKICGMQAARRCWELGGKITKPLVRTLFRGIGHCFDQTNWFVTASVVFKKGYHVNCSFYRLQDLVIIILIQESLR